jgi:hypothetical protein
MSPAAPLLIIIFIEIAFRRLGEVLEEQCDVSRDVPDIGGN